MGFAKLSFSWNISFGLGWEKPRENRDSIKRTQPQTRNDYQKVLPRTSSPEKEDKPPKRTDQLDDATSSHALEAAKVQRPNTREQDCESLALLMQHSRRATKKSSEQVPRRKAHYETPEKTTFWPKDLRKNVLPVDPSTDSPKLNSSSIERAFGLDGVRSRDSTLSSRKPLASPSSSAWTNPKPVMLREETDDFWTTYGVGSNTSAESEQINSFLELLKSVQVSGVATRVAEEAGGALKVSNERDSVKDGVGRDLEMAEYDERSDGVTRDVKCRDRSALGHGGMLGDELTDFAGLTSSKSSQAPSIDECCRQHGTLVTPAVNGLSCEYGWEVVDEGGSQ